MPGYVCSSPNKPCLGDLLRTSPYPFVALGHFVLWFTLPFLSGGLSASLFELFLYPTDLFPVPTGFMWWCVIPSIFIFDVSFMHPFNPKDFLLLCHCLGKLCTCGIVPCSKILDAYSPLRFGFTSMMPGNVGCFLIANSSTP